MSDALYDLSGHRIEKIEPRADGLVLCRDLDDGTRVICRPQILSPYPRANVNTEQRP